jgi:NAD(P)-dependent dehydrogenase (short-subunit alcohol dehydrogenase family)
MDGKVAIVTGAGTGIGRAIALRLTAAGALTLCADVDEASALGTAEEITAAGGRGEGVRCDVSSADDMERLVERAAGLGGPHALVSNAAVQYEQLLVDTPPDDWDRVLAVNLKSVYLGARAVIPHMRRLGGGSIVNMASVNGFWVEPALAAYCAAKGGVINLTRALALEWAPNGIRVNAVAPTYVRTRLTAALVADAEVMEQIAARTPLGRLAEVEEVADAVLFLAGRGSAMVTGHVLAVDGGYLAQ